MDKKNRDSVNHVLLGQVNTEILRTLLLDRTTRKNVIWATDDYVDKGYKASDEINVSVVAGFLGSIIQPRILKSEKYQKVRTRKKGEVFTPSWVCNKQNNMADEAWFGQDNIFNLTWGKEWKMQDKQIIFPPKRSRSWQKYVDSKRLEITCGEAPYLVSRYESVTGEWIPICNRIGVLDRKIRVVNENTNNFEQWFKWIIRAYQSTYGYDIQGDNILIARMNLLLTFIEAIEERWKRRPTIQEVKTIARIISWNIWQMDAFTFCIPKPGIDKTNWIDLFSEIEDETNSMPTYCKITDWRYKRSLPVVALKETYWKEKCAMKFDVVIGNPPYQEDTKGAGRQARPIYQYFVNESKRISKENVVLIMPSRWFAGGMGLEDFRNEMMNDRHVIKLVDYTNAKDCFPNNSVGGGICYFLWDKTKEDDCQFINITHGKRSQLKRPLNEFQVIVRYNEAISIIHKVMNNTCHYLTEITSSLMPFGLNTNYRGSQLQTTTNNIRLYASNGITYISKNVITKNEKLINKYKVFISKTGAEHAGEPGKDGKFRVLTSSLKVAPPNTACTHSYFVIGNFDDKKQAENLLGYLKTCFVRFLILQAMTSINLSKLVFPFVPMQDFSDKWDDRKLYNKYNLNNDEINFIESMIKEMA